MMVMVKIIFGVIAIDRIAAGMILLDVRDVVGHIGVVQGQ